MVKQPDDFGKQKCKTVLFLTTPTESRRAICSCSFSKYFPIQSQSWHFWCTISTFVFCWAGFWELLVLLYNVRSNYSLHSVVLSYSFCSVPLLTRCGNILLEYMLCCSDSSKHAIGYVSNPSKVVHCWRIRHECGNILGEFEQYRM